MTLQALKIWLTLTTHWVLNQAPVSSCLHSFGLRRCKQGPLGYCRVMAWPGICMRYFWEWMEVLQRIRRPNWARPDADWNLPGQSNIQSCPIIHTFWGTVSYGKVRILVEVSQAVGLWEIVSCFCALGFLKQWQWKSRLKILEVKKYRTWSHLLQLIWCSNLSSQEPSVYVRVGTVLFSFLTECIRVPMIDNDHRVQNFLSVSEPTVLLPYKLVTYNSEAPL